MFDQDVSDEPEYRELSRRRVRSARKQYKCCMCGRPIYKGQTHTIINSITDGEFASDRMHDEWALCATEE